MSQRISKPMVKAKSLLGVSSMLLKDNIEPYKFYKHFGLTPEIEDRELELIPLKLFVEILEHLKKLTTYNHPSINLSRIQHASETELYFNLIRNAPNIYIASQIAQQFRAAWAETNFWDFSIDEKYTLVQRKSFSFIDINDREFCLYGIANVYQLMTSIIGDEHKLKRISLVQPRESYELSLESYFECPISFNQDFDGFILNTKDVYRKNVKFDAVRYKKLLNELSLHPVIFPKNLEFSTLVKSLIAKTLSTGNYSIKTIAEIMGVHERTIQNRLSKEGLNFSMLVEEVQMNSAKRLLAQRGIPLTQISLMLGYSELSAFSRAFKNKNKYSPREWRNKIVQ